MILISLNDFFFNISLLKFWKWRDQAPVDGFKFLALNDFKSHVTRCHIVALNRHFELGRKTTRGFGAGSKMSANQRIRLVCMNYCLTFAGCRLARKRETIARQRDTIGYVVLIGTLSNAAAAPASRYRRWHRWHRGESWAEPAPDCGPSECHWNLSPSSSYSISINSNCHWFKYF